jgi:hypothetical protein
VPAVLQGEMIFPGEMMMNPKNLRNIDAIGFWKSKQKMSFGKCK